jgi:hypothetical protein
MCIKPTLSILKYLLNPQVANIEKARSDAKLIADMLAELGKCVCVYVYVYVCMCVYVYMCVCVCVYVCMCVCFYVCMYVGGDSGYASRIR